MELATLAIYTDRSSINSYVGTTAVVPILRLLGIRTKRTEYMGKSTTFTVYAAELRGI